MTNDELLRRIGNSEIVIEMYSTPARLFMLIGQLQLALRHPSNNGESKAVTRAIAENMTEAICHHFPEARPLIEAGWDDSNDMTSEEFEQFLADSRNP